MVEALFGVFQKVVSPQNSIHDKCHCRDCQRSSGSAFVAAVYLAKSALTVTGEVSYCDTQAVCGELLIFKQNQQFATDRRYVPETGTVEPFVLAQEIKFPLHTPKCPPAGARAPSDAERVVALIRALVKKTRKYNAHTTQEDAQWTESVIADAHDALEVPFEACIVMQDYHEDNVVVERFEDGWRISGVFDLGVRTSVTAKLTFAGCLQLILAKM